MEGSIGSITSRKHEEHLSPSYASPLPRPPPKPDPNKSALSQNSEGIKENNLGERSGDFLWLHLSKNATPVLFFDSSQGDGRQM
jgi:hypothetical protein